MIVAVSDVHLGYEKSNGKDFSRFLEKCDSAGIDHLVLLGDVLDFWRRNNAEVVTEKENAKILDKIARLNVKNIHYIVGNHDYYLLRLNERYAGNYPFIISKSLRLEDGGRKFYFIHGYELEVLANLEPLSIENYEKFSENMCFAENVIGGLASFLWGFVEKECMQAQIRKMRKSPHLREKIDKIYNIAISQARYMLIGMKPDEGLVYGHTHRPFINKGRTVANTGSWVDEVNELSKEKSQNKYVKISNGLMELKTFDEKNFP
jgi:UDP-2,3-diacylglucosamine pyrophosphatase LpxH